MDKLLTFVVLCLALLLSACSSVEFKQDGPEEFAINVRPALTKIEIVEGVCDTYFWGIFPSDCAVNLQDEFRERKISEPAFVKVSQGHSWANALMTVITLGIYFPVSYQVSVYAKPEI